MRLHSILAPIVALGVALTPASSAMAAPTQANIDTLVHIYTTLEETHFSHPDEEVLLRGAITGMLETLGDPYTSYLTPAEYQGLMGAINQEYAGIGTLLRPLPDGTLLITEVYAGSPAEEAGLLAGDQIVSVDGVGVTAGNVQAMPGQIRGAEGTQVTLVVLRPGSAPATLLITRSAIELPTVTADDLGDGLAYIQILSFGERTAEEVTEAVNAAKRRGARALVLDVRGNGGGYVVAALEIADLFLSDGVLITVHDEDGEPIPLEADPAVATAMPIALLVDGQSASASEILAGSLQKNHRASLVGSTTFGKGTMQYPEELPNGGYLKVSADRWAYADGSHSDRVGLTPDLAVATPSLALPAAVQRLGSTLTALTYSRTGAGATFGAISLPDAPPVIEQEGRLYLPLRYTLEALGHEVKWAPAISEASFLLGGIGVQADLARGTLTRSGVRVGTAGDVVLIDGRSYIAADALGTLLGRPPEVTESTVTVR